MRHPFGPPKPQARLVFRVPLPKAAMMPPPSLPTLNRAPVGVPKSMAVLLAPPREMLAGKLIRSRSSDEESVDEDEESVDDESVVRESSDVVVVDLESDRVPSIPAVRLPVGRRLVGVSAPLFGVINVFIRLTINKTTNF